VWSSAFSPHLLLETKYGLVLLQVPAGRTPSQIHQAGGGVKNILNTGAGRDGDSLFENCRFFEILCERGMR
jgi:hypothetical protein